jgi:hypothetical protein
MTKNDLNKFFFISWLICVSWHNLLSRFDENERKKIFVSCRFRKKWLIYLSSKSDFEINWLFWLTRFIIYCLNRRFWAWCWSLTWKFIVNVRRFHFVSMFLTRLIFIQCHVQNDDCQIHHWNISFFNSCKDDILDCFHVYYVAENV